MTNRYPKNTKDALCFFIKRVNLFNNNKLGLQSLISDVEGLAGFLESKNPKLQTEFHNKWEILEEINALQLSGEPILVEGGAKSAVRNTLCELKGVAEQALLELQ